MRPDDAPAPTDPDNTATPDPARTPPTPPRAPSTTQARPKVLIIDDEAGPRESIRLSLERDCDCLAVEDGFRGLEVLESFDPDLVILDIKMPKIDGIETLRRLREKNSEVEVMLLTAYGSLETAQKAIRHGVFDYIEKPFDLHELRATVSRGLARRRRRRRLESRQDEMEQMLARVRRDLASFDRLARIGQLSAGIVHEMKNPLTVILGYTQMLMGRLRREREGEGEGIALSDESARYLSMIEQETVRCTQIARQLLSYSRAPRDERQRTTLYELLTNIRMLIQPQCSVNDVALTAEPPEESVMLKVSVGQMHDVLLNLCMNALEAMAGPGTLAITGRVVRKDGGGLDDITGAERAYLHASDAAHFAAIDVTDSGPGIAPEHVARVFEPFFSTKADGAGTGLGLAMCKENVEEHDGTIGVVRTGPDGTTFRIILPAL